MAMLSLRRLLVGLSGSLLCVAIATAQEAPLTPFQPFQVLTDAQLNALVDRINSQGSALAALQAALATAHTEIAALRAALASQGDQQLLQTVRSDLATLQANPVLALAPYMNIEPGVVNGLMGPHLVLHGINVHLQSGAGATDDQGQLSGLGNLVIGYNEEPIDLQTGERHGSHNFIIGHSHRYSSHGGLVAGAENSVTGAAASVTGGRQNVASGEYANVSGGVGIQAAAPEAWAAGGLLTLVQGDLGAFGLYLDTLDSDLHDAENALAGVQDMLSTVQADLHTVQDTLSSKAAESDLNTLSSEVLFTQSQLVAVEGDLHTVQAALASKAEQSAVSALQVELASKAEQSAVSALQAELASKAEQSALHGALQDLQALQQNAVLALGDFVEVEPNDLHGLRGPHVIFHGVNVHITSGTGATDDYSTLSGLGNLVIGYNEMPTGLQASERHGSHNLIIGYNHRYSSFGGFVGGLENTLAAPATSVLGGHLNTASGAHASVSGGSENTAGGEDASVSGGNNRQATDLNDWAAGSLFEDQ